MQECGDGNSIPTTSKPGCFRGIVNLSPYSMSMTFAKFCSMAYRFKKTKPSCLLASLFLTACVSSNTTPYPSTWPPLLGNATCSPTDIVGLYANRGEEVNLAEGEIPKMSDYNLSDVLLQTPNDRIRADSATVIEIAARDSTLYVRALRDSQVLSSAQYTKNSLYCEDGWLTIDYDVPQGGIVLGTDKLFMMLHLAVDGSLVVKRFVKETGLSFYVVPFPVSGSSTMYMRYQKQHS